MTNMIDFEKQLSKTKKVKTAVDKLRNASPDIYAKFRKYFHLRPCTGYITIVSTHKDRPMRGIEVSVTKLIDAVKFLTECIKDNDTINWDKIAEEFIRKKGKVLKKGFEKGDKKKPNGGKEYPHQAEMINNLENNTKLKKILDVKNLYFAASEVIFHRGKNEGKTGIRKKIDIVAHDGEGKIFLFEMKAPGTKDDSVTQVEGYLKMYGNKGSEENKTFEEMLKNYPQGSITEINSYDGYGVIGYSDNPVLISNKLIDCTR